MAVVGQRVAYHAAFAVACAVAGAHHHLGLAVAVEVIHDEGGVVGAAADVPAQVDAPEQRAVKAVTIEKGRARVAIVGVVVGVRGVPFQDDLIFSVAVDIAYAGVVGSIEVAPAVGRLSVGGLLQLHRQVAFGSVGSEGVAAIELPAAHLVGGRRRERFVVDKEGAARGQGLAIELFPVAEDIVGLMDGIGGKCAPADDDLPSAADGNDTPVQPFALDVLHVVVGLGNSR